MGSWLCSNELWNRSCNGCSLSRWKRLCICKKYNLPLNVVINPVNKETKEVIELKAEEMTEAFTEVGVMTNSGEFNGMSSKEALTK